MRFVFLFCLLTFHGFSQISEQRQLQLDSIVTNLDKNVLRNLDSLHFELHTAGRNNEERVFLFFGVIAIHHKYDYARKGDKQAKEYTPHYVAFKRKGVCRDFALLFDELCERSDVPCVIAQGRCQVGLKDGIKDLFKRRIKRVNHAWNVVKYNDKWHPIDPTWSKIDTIQKYYTYDDTGKRKYAGRVKVSNREYYNKEPKDFYRKRTCVHPAFYCMDTIYTYKTSQKKYEKRDVYTTGFDYSSVLDSLDANEHYNLGKAYNEVLKDYSELNYLYVPLQRDFKFTEIKHSKFDPLTPASCDSHLVNLEDKLKIIEKERGYILESHFNDHKQEVLKLKKKLIRREQSKSRFR